MAELEIRPCMFDEIAQDPAYGALIAAYADESALAGLPRPQPRLDIYLDLERRGVLRIVGAWQDGALLGFISVLTSVLPHYGVPVATTESFYVARDKRGTAAGLRLLLEARRQAREAGGVGLLVSAPHGSTLAQVLNKMHCRQTNDIFFMGVHDD